MKTPTLTLVVGLALIGTSFAVDPPPDGGYPNQNTAEGEDALYSITTGRSDTAIGYNALYHNTVGINNTATGTNSLLRNTSGSNNTAAGFEALSANTTGTQNTAGVQALLSNTAGGQNTAVGVHFVLTRPAQVIPLWAASRSGLTRPEPSILQPGSIRSRATPLGAKILPTAPGCYLITPQVRITRQRV